MHGLLQKMEMAKAKAILMVMVIKTVKTMEIAKATMIAMEMAKAKVILMAKAIATAMLVATSKSMVKGT